MATRPNNYTRKVRNSYLVSTISISLVLFLVGVVGYILANLLFTANDMREGVTMIVELKDGLSDEERNAISERLSKNEVVASIEYISKEEKLKDEEFRKTFAVDIESTLGENPLPDTFDVTLSAKAEDEAALDKFIEEVKTVEGVTHISYPKMLLNAMHSALDTMQLIVLLFGGAMLVVSLLLVSNTVRLAVFSERELINVLKAVGATRGFILKPFLGKALLQGFAAGCLATILLGGCLYGVDATLPDLGLGSQVELFLMVAGAMVAGGMVIALLATLFVVNKFVSMKSNKIHLY